ncbi:MAG TPA: PAS domain S-box protein [Burkholderiales bacterium]|nr:PAS domain S-box protein [Burkholderiales bacterium]
MSAPANAATEARPATTASGPAGQLGRIVVLTVGIAAAYVLSAKVALALFPATKSVAMLWPSAGIALAALLVWGIRALPGVFIGCLIAHVSAADDAGGAVASAGLTTVYTAAAWVLLANVARLDLGLRRVSDVLALAVLGAGTVALTKAAIRAAALMANGAWGTEALLQTAVSALATGVGILIVAPVCLTLYAARRDPVPHGRRIELALVAAATLGVSILVFSERFSPMVAVAQLPYAVFPVLFWAGLRFGPREVSGVLFLAAVVAVWYTSLGEGPFAGGERIEGMASLYLFLTVLAVTSLLFAAALRQREEADAAVHASEQRNRLLVERMNEGLAMLDRNGTMHYVSDRFCEIAGYRREDLVGKRGVELAAPEGREQWEEHHRARQRGVGDSFEMTMVRGNGERIDVNVSPRPLFDESGAYAGSFALITDVTARKRAEAALRQSEKQYRLLVENQTELILTLGRIGVVRFASPSYRQLFGADAADVVGRPLALEVHEDDRETTARAWQAAWAPPYSTSMENRVLTPRGWVWLAWSIRAVRDERAAAAPDEVVAVARDVTDRHRAEEQARQHLQSLAHVARVSSMGEMASAIAHEVNQPLTAIANYVYACMRLLRSGASTQGEALQVMQRVATEAERAGEVVRKMRSFVRGEEGQVSAVDANFLATEVLRLATPEARQSGVELVPALDSGLPEVCADSIQIQQVLLNLVRNAVEAIVAGGARERTVRIETARGEPGCVELRVSDTGPGLAPESLEKVFEPFYTTKADGIGIGLALSRSIADAHGGRLWATGAPGRGATFHLSLPIATETEEHDD